MAIAPPITVIQQSFEGIGGRAIGAGAGSVTALTAAQIRAIADLSGYVPYTGATTTLDLGTNALTVGAVTASGTLTMGTTKILSQNGGRIDLSYTLAAAGMVLDGYFNGGYIRVASGHHFSWTQYLHSNAAPDTSLSRQSAGIVQIGVGPGNASGSLACSAITASSTLTLQNSTTAVIAEFSKTYTSATSREYLQLGYNATAATYDVASKVGSAGGVNQPIRLGHYAADGTTFSGLTVATNGAVTSLGAMTVSSSLAVTGGEIQASSNVRAAPGVLIYWRNRSTMSSPSDGSIVFSANDGVTRSALTCADINASGATFTGQISLNGHAKLGGVSAGIAGVYAADGVTAGSLEVDEVRKVGSSTVAFRLDPYNGANDIARIEAGALEFWMTGVDRFRITPSYTGNLVNHLPLLAGLDLGSTTAIWRKAYITAIDARNGTTATELVTHKTYTSATSREYLSLGYNTTAGYYDLASKVGSAGGVNQPIRLGHYAADGTTFSGLSVATNGTAAFSRLLSAKGWLAMYAQNSTTLSGYFANGQAIFTSGASGATDCGLRAVGSLGFSVNDSSTPALVISSTGTLTTSGTITGRASTTAAATAPIKLPTGVLMTTPEAGGIEYDGTNLYFTDSGGTRRQLQVV